MVVHTCTIAQYHDSRAIAHSMTSLPWEGHRHRGLAGPAPEGGTCPTELGVIPRRGQPGRELSGFRLTMDPAATLSALVCIEIPMDASRVSYARLDGDSTSQPPAPRRTWPAGAGRWPARCTPARPAPARPSSPSRSRSLQAKAAGAHGQSWPDLAGPCLAAERDADHSMSRER